MASSNAFSRTYRDGSRDSTVVEPRANQINITGSDHKSTGHIFQPEIRKSRNMVECSWFRQAIRDRFGAERVAGGVGHAGFPIPPVGIYPLAGAAVPVGRTGPVPVWKRVSRLSKGIVRCKQRPYGLSPRVATGTTPMSARIAMSMFAYSARKCFLLVFCPACLQPTLRVQINLPLAPSRAKPLQCNPAPKALRHNSAHYGRRNLESVFQCRTLQRVPGTFGIGVGVAEAIFCQPGVQPPEQHGRL